MTLHESATTIALAVILALGAGWALGQWWRARELRKNRGRVKREFRDTIEDARRIAKAMVLEAEIRIREEEREKRAAFEASTAAVRSEIKEREVLLLEQLRQVRDRQSELEARAESLRSLEQAVRCDSEGASQLRREAARALEEIAGLSESEAKERLIAETRERIRERLAREAYREESDAERERAYSAKKALLDVMNASARAVITTQAVIPVHLPTAEMKGRVIGKDGRNIRAFEAIAGVDLVLDELSDLVLISSHSPERRVVAEHALRGLLDDGRIQPSRIEEFIQRSREHLPEILREKALSVLSELGVVGVPEPVIEVLGRLALRSSVAQNVLAHSHETAQFARRIANELGLEPEIAVRAALFHDIGKVLGDELPGPHALAGAEFLRRHGEEPIVVNAVAAHHNEVPGETPYATIVQIADTLSGGRPGARREDTTEYARRLEEMESIARAHNGVDEAFALQAGRELRVIVVGESLGDEMVPLLAHEIASDIEGRLRHRGDVKVTVVREVRASALATWGSGDCRVGNTEVLQETLIPD